ncbi:hypothetical protein [Desulfosporosinus fructosivorans]|uniref:hypothetical protein n=1 Tax=Desulfosporosinus fructosivorans TaxID=2018669 RepID=UPI001FB1501B|nr:hypothetical protein [Desulfosporosinus fructosivorans]
MQICCTKKLNDEMGIVPGKGTEENDLFCWSVQGGIINKCRIWPRRNGCQRSDNAGYLYSDQGRAA